MKDSHKLPDTPWHIGYAKKEEDDPRRHQARCVHFNDGICHSYKSRYYNKRCGGSSHCGEYAETIEQYEVLTESKKTAEEIERSNIDRYRRSLESKKKELAQKENAWSYIPLSKTLKCYVCESALSAEKRGIKSCPFCGMNYVSQKKFVSENLKDDFFFVVGKTRPKNNYHFEWGKKSIKVSKKIRKKNSGDGSQNSSTN